MDRKNWKRRLQLRVAVSSPFLVPKLGSFSLRRNNKTISSSNIIMGNAPIQKAVAKPLRPFDRNVNNKNRKLITFSKKNKKCNNNSASSSSTSILVQLIARRDWQKVLIRASLFPNEISQTQVLHWYGIEWTILPLHLACALHPPASVVSALTTCTTAATTMTKRMNAATQPPNPIRKRKLIFRKKTRARAAALQDLHTAKTEDESSDGERREQSATIAPTAVTTWNLSSLNDTDHLLPIHIACLYRASSAVLSVLLQAHPESARTTTLNSGMLPIHIVSDASIGDMPPPIQSPADFECLAPDDTRTAVADSLLVLIALYPESRLTGCTWNGQTPYQMLQTTMEDACAEKSECLRVLQPIDADGNQFMQDVESILTENEEESTRFVPLEIVCDDEPSVVTKYELPHSETLSQNPLYAFMASQRWEAAYTMVEEEPERSHQWQYGIDKNKAAAPWGSESQSQLWKRLPIHHACRFGAPMAVFSILLQHNPQLPADPYTGTLPLHLTCRYAGPYSCLETVELLLEMDPSSVREPDHAGRLPIHFACLHHGAASIVQLLMKAYPGSVAIKDKDGKTPYDFCDTRKMDTDVLKQMKKLQHVLQRVEERKLLDEHVVFAKPTSPLGLEISTQDKSKEEQLQSEMDTNPEALMMLP